MSMKLVFAAAAVAVSAGAASAAPLFFDDFESYTVGDPGSIAPTWYVGEGSVDVIGTNYGWYPGKQIDMNGSVGDINGATASFIGTYISGFTIGRTYALSFNYGSNKNSNGDEQLIYQVADPSPLTFLLLNAVLTSGPVPNLLHSGKLLFKATNTTLNLSFADGQFGSPYNDDDDQGGPILDNVQIAAVPLPAAAPLLLAALGGLGLIRRRRRV